MSSHYDRNQLQTVHLVPLTAFDPEGRVDVSVQSDHIEKMYGAGIRVFLPAAGTSEFQSLSADEVVQIVQITREATGADAQVFAPVGLQVGHAIEVGRRAVEAGADGIMFSILLVLMGTTMFSVIALIQTAAMDIAEGQQLEGSMVGLLWGNNALFGAASPLLLGWLIQIYGSADTESFWLLWPYAAVLSGLGVICALFLPGLSAKGSGS